MKNAEFLADFKFADAGFKKGSLENNNNKNCENEKTHPRSFSTITLRDFFKVGIKEFEISIKFCVF
jgi:hypothetical protein